jgi:hypothetical protein
MTDEEALALAVRLVACPQFCPLPGMRDMQGRTWTPDLMWRWNRTIDRPDLRDPATLGCVLALVREAYGDPALYVRLSDTTRQSDGVRAWEVLGWLSRERSPDRRGGSWRGWGYATEAEALVAALEAAP